MNKTLDTALILANSGIHVYPLSTGSKVPLQGSHGEHDATTDLDSIREWFTNNDYNLAINLKASGLTVLDLDKHSQNTNGVTNWSNYLLNNGNDAVDSLKTYSEYTPQAGMHIFYKFDGNLPGDIELLPGVELLTDKVTIAPSHISKSHKSYQPSYDGFPILEKDKLLDLPKFIIQFASQTQRKKKSNTTIHFVSSQPKRKRWTGYLLDELVHGASQGDRNNYLTKLAGKMFHVGADSDSIYNLLSFANSNCEPPLPDHEVNTIFGSILKKNGVK